MIRFMLITLLLAITPFTFAGPKDNIYAGLGFGGAFDSYKLTAKKFSPAFTTVNSTNDNSVVANIFAGFGATFEPGWYLGGELGTYLPKRQTVITGRLDPFLSPYRFSDTLGVIDYATLDVLPGFRFNEVWLGYIRAGLSFANLSLNQGSVGSVLGFNTSQTHIGGRLGLGVNYALNEHIGLGVDYFFTQYTNLSTTNYFSNTSFTTRVYSNYLGLSASYSF